MSLKRRVKIFLQKSLPTEHPAYLVASFGRAGSTLIFDSLISGIANSRFGSDKDFCKRVVRDAAWVISETEFSPGVIYKTHDYPCGLEKKGNIKSIFMFGSMLESALSVHSQMAIRGPEWVRRHFDHLRSPHGVEDLFKFDALGFMNQTKSWIEYESKPVLCVRYENLWNYRDEISEYCGFEVEIPERRSRSHKVNNENIISAAHKIYDPLDAKLARLPDCFIARAEMGAYLDSDSIAQSLAE